MPKCKLYENWTWDRPLPSPFNDPTIVKRSDTKISKYNAPMNSATLHSAALTAILTYLELDIAEQKGVGGKGAVGTQGSYLIGEYPSRSGQNHIVVYNELNGKFLAVCSDGTPTNGRYELNENKQSGAALFFALMPAALADEEFAQEYAKLAEYKKTGYPSMTVACEAGYVLCDNLYRRIVNASTLGNAGIPVIVEDSGSIPLLTSLSIKQGVYSPTQVLHGKFQIMKEGAPGSSKSISHKSFAGQYPLSDRKLTAEEQELVPSLPKWFLIPPEAVEICLHACKTTSGNSPMRNFMMRGPSGAGKTEATKAIAAGLGLPYRFQTCSSNTDMLELTFSIIPQLQDNHVLQDNELPTMEDIVLDPATAYCKMTGEYRKEVTLSEVYRELVLQIRKQVEKDCGTGAPRFTGVDSPLIRTLRYGGVVELQEPSVIRDPGVLVGLNGILDNGRAFQLPTGEVIHRHPDAVLIITTNYGYAGTREMNQSVLSRMDLISDIEIPEPNILAKRVAKITGFQDHKTLVRMAECITLINELCRRQAITDGVCGTRELVAWAQSTMILGDPVTASRNTVVSLASADRENQELIFRDCIKQKVA